MENMGWYVGGAGGRNTGAEARGERKQENQE